MKSSYLIGISRHRIGVDGAGVTTLVAFHGCPLRCIASNTLIIRYEHNTEIEFEPFLETVVLLLQITDSKCNMPNFYIFFSCFHVLLANTECLFTDAEHLTH